MVYSFIDIAIATIKRTIARQHHLIFAGRRQYTVIRERFERVEIIHKHKISATVCQNLIIVLLPQFRNRQILEIIYAAYQRDHRIVEIVEIRVFQLLTVNKIPLPTGILVAPSVPLAREIYPLGMAELVTHEVEIATIDGRRRDQTYHLMQGHATRHGHIVVILHHVPVHLIVDQTENHRLVAHQSLIVAFYIGDCLFIGTPVGQFPEYRRRMPVFVFFLFQSLDPIVGYSHGHTVIKTDAPVLERYGQARHAAHLFGYGDCRRIDLMYQFVGQSQICDGIHILMTVIVVVIRAESLPEPMTVIQH